MSEPSRAGNGPADPRDTPVPPPSSRPGSEWTAPAPLAPVAATQRVEILDALRGFAIFGILLVNMALFFSPMHLLVLNEPAVTGPLDELARKAIVFFAQGKFYSLFSFLFGMGLAIQMERAEGRGRTVGGFFARRMFWLLLIGLAHALLFWFGDILVLYSLLGFALLLFRNCRPKTLAFWTILFLAAPVVIGALQVGRLVFLRQADPQAAEQVLQPQREWLAEVREDVAPTVQAYSSGSWPEIVATRAAEWVLYLLIAIPTFSPMVLALFLVGLNVGRRRFFHRLDQNLPLIRRWVWPLFALGAVLNFLLVYLGERVQPEDPNLESLALIALFVIAPPVLSAAYVAAICLLWQRPGWRRGLGLLAPVGRMALSNYLMHSIVFTAVSYSYGLGLYGEISYLEGLGLTVLMFALQIPLSAWWLSRFRFGPLEWLWRTLSYRRMQPMRR